MPNVLYDSPQSSKKQSKQQAIQFPSFSQQFHRSSCILPIDYKHIMKPQARFQTILPDKQRLKELRETAIIERDFMRLKEHNLRIQKIIAVTLVLVFIAAISITVTVLVSHHFHALIRNLDNCVVQHYQGSDFFRPVCVTCRKGFQMLNGTCMGQM